MPLRRVEHISIGIEHPFAAVYDFLAAPENFPKWAEGLGKTFRHVGGLDWQVDTPLGSMRVRFSPRNAYGVADHALYPDGGEPMDNPLRVIRNGTGSEVTFTLLQRPGMTDEQFRVDADWVRKDLAALKALLESDAAAP